MIIIEKVEGKLTWRVDADGNVSFQHADCGGVNYVLRGEPGFYLSTEQIYEKIKQLRDEWERVRAAMCNENAEP